MKGNIAAHLRVIQIVCNKWVGCKFPYMIWSEIHENMPSKKAGRKYNKTLLTLCHKTLTLSQKVSEFSFFLLYFAVYFQIFYNEQRLLDLQNFTYCNI